MKENIVETGRGKDGSTFVYGDYVIKATKYGRSVYGDYQIWGITVTKNLTPIWTQVVYLKSRRELKSAVEWVLNTAIKMERLK